MQVKFQVKLTEGEIKVTDLEIFTPIKLEDAEILWDIDTNKILRSVYIVFNGVDIVKDSAGVILTTNRELDEKAFKIATYISNKIFLDTGIDGLDPTKVLDNSPIILAENAGEKDIIEKSKKKGFVTLDVIVIDSKPFELDKFQEDIIYSEVITFYAEAKRTKNLIQKYELLYKIIEYFFPNKIGDKLDKAVSDYCKQYNSAYGSEKFIESFRKLRNRCIHPAHKEHVNLENLSSIRDVVDMVPQIEGVVKILLDYPCV